MSSVEKCAMWHTLKAQKSFKLDTHPLQIEKCVPILEFFEIIPVGRNI